MLEGGYRIQGGLVSAFARSVAAHVAALKQPHRQVCTFNLLSTGSCFDYVLAVAQAHVSTLDPFVLSLAGTVWLADARVVMTSAR